MNPLDTNKIMACAADDNIREGAEQGSETVTSKEASAFDGDGSIKLYLRQNGAAAVSASDGSILDELECQEIQTASFQAPNLEMGNL